MTTVTISAADVNKLRHQTGSGMMDCKKALTEANGDFEKAIEILRLKGAKISASRADRETKEGVVVTKISADGKTGIILGLSCETDFVARGEGFIAFAEQCATLGLTNTIANVETLKSANLENVTLAEAIIAQIGKIGEKIDVVQYALLTGECVVSYIHSNKKNGALIALNQASTEAILAAGKQVGMQIVSMNPVSLDKSDVSEEIVKRELDLAKEKAKQDGKPDNMLDKIANGALEKFYKEATLLNQEFIMDGSKKVSQMLDGVSKGLTVTAFNKVTLG
ncbi:MAG: translation elongation factor Ts [Bacteroidetes bacterium]|nr:translation elongation factor Ts [Bacteroidota bacterium]